MRDWDADYFEVKKMRVFLSWSGKLSNSVAKELSKWLPCLIDVEVFFSTDDIAKGENWVSSITQELAKCDYGIICLTQDNKEKEWINFEAGAIFKALDSHLSTLLIDLVPSDIQGPLKLYQATTLEKADFLALIKSINNVLGDAKKDEDVLSNRFDAMWENMKNSFDDAISKSVKKERKTNKATETANTETRTTEATEEILQMLRQQNIILNNPERFFNRLRNEKGDYSTLNKIVQEAEESLFEQITSVSSDGEKEVHSWTSRRLRCASIQECLFTLKFMRKKLILRTFKLDPEERQSLIDKCMVLQMKYSEALLPNISESKSDEEE